MKKHEKWVRINLKFLFYLDIHELVEKGRILLNWSIHVVLELLFLCYVSPEKYTQCTLSGTEPWAPLSYIPPWTDRDMQ